MDTTTKTAYLGPTWRRTLEAINPHLASRIHSAFGSNNNRNLRSHILTALGFSMLTIARPYRNLNATTVGEPHSICRRRLENLQSIIRIIPSPMCINEYKYPNNLRLVHLQLARASCQPTTTHSTRFRHEFPRWRQHQPPMPHLNRNSSRPPPLCNLSTFPTYRHRIQSPC